MKRKPILPLILCLLLLTGCAAPGKELPEYAPKPENRLVIYTSHKDYVYQPIVREFEERTGIWVEVVTGGTNDLLARIESEAENPVADVMFGGGAESLESCRDSFAPYACSECGMIDPQYGADADCWAPFSALPVVLVYNTKLVDPDAIHGWADLARPEFAGKIAFADPSRSGSSFTILNTLLFAMGEDGMNMLAKGLDAQLESSGDVLNTVSDGTNLIGITLEETALTQIQEGASLAMVFPSEGTSCVCDGTAIIQGAPHEENARKFVEFTLSQDVQSLLSRQFFRRSVRSDISNENLIPISQISLVDYDIARVVRQRSGLLSRWESLLGGDHNG